MKNKKLKINKNKLKDYQKQIAELTEALKRKQANFENFQKRIENQTQEFAKFANENLILELLPVLDNFDRSLAHIKNTNNPLFEGIQLIKKQLQDILSQNGVEKITTKGGDRFDPQIHEAIGGKGEKISEIVLDGYRLNGKVIRAVRVKVGK